MARMGDIEQAGHRAGVRSLTVAALGPILMALGVAWTLLRLWLAEPATDPRSIVFTPAHQMIVAGALVSLICLPVAIEMFRAEPGDLEIPTFEGHTRMVSSPGRGGMRDAPPG
jgi:hypothetical protein